MNLREVCDESFHFRVGNNPGSEQRSHLLYFDCDRFPGLDAGIFAGAEIQVFASNQVVAECAIGTEVFDGKRHRFPRQIFAGIECGLEVFDLFIVNFAATASRTDAGDEQAEC